MTQNTNTPIWGEKHDKIVAQYEERAQSGSIKEIVMIPKDKE
jgi:hypothetical protein